MSGIASSRTRDFLRATFGLFGIGLALLLIACSKTESSGASHPTLTTIRLQNIAIHPNEVTISRGSSVKWVWLDQRLDTPHNVTSRSGGAQFKGSGTRRSGSYTVRFEKSGTYLYECTIHPASMQGEIVVK